MNRLSKNGMKACIESGHRSAEIQKERKKERIELYNQNPSFCLKCDVQLPYSKRKNKFCSRSCSVSYNNIGVVRNGTSPDTIECESCGKATTNPKFCSQKCQGQYKRFLVFERIESGSLSETERAYRRYLIHKHGPLCMKCGWSEKNKFTNKIPIILNHINGNSNNNQLSNLELLCPNCDSMTPYYKGANKGNGRLHRRIRHKKDKNRMI